MGIGSYLSRFLDKGLAQRFVEVELGVVLGVRSAVVGLWSTWVLAPVLAHAVRLRVKAVALSLCLVVGLALGERLTTFSEEQLFADEVVNATTSPYQRIVLTRGKRGFSLFLNGNLQFAS